MSQWKSSREKASWVGLGSGVGALSGPALLDVTSDPANQCLGVLSLLSPHSVPFCTLLSWEAPPTATTLSHDLYLFSTARLRALPQATSTFILGLSLSWLDNSGGPPICTAVSEDTGLGFLHICINGRGIHP